VVRTTPDTTTRFIGRGGPFDGLIGPQLTTLTAKETATYMPFGLTGEESKLLTALIAPTPSRPSAR
jgi:hypothetical protein